jgi:hypothetical protein
MDGRASRPGYAQPDGRPMTRMSDSAGRRGGPTRANRACRRGSWRVARLLLRSLRIMPGVLVGVVLVGPGCVLPADLEPAGADAGPSSPPVILVASPPDFALPGPVLVSRENSPTARDVNVDETLYVRLFVDYAQPPDLQPRPGRADCQEGPNGTTERIIDCSTNALCSDIPDDDTSNHVLEAMIVDRTFLLDGDPAAEGQPPFRAIEDRVHAGYSSVSWVMRCQPAQ